MVHYGAVKQLYSSIISYSYLKECKMAVQRVQRKVLGNLWRPEWC